MVKRIIFGSWILTSSFLFSQNTGINTTKPEATLDVNGTARIQNLYANPAPAGLRTVAVDANGFLKSKPDVPGNAVGDLPVGTAYTTNVNASDFAPSVIKFIPHGGVLGYKFSIVNGIWYIEATPSDGITYGTQYAEIEILWLNR